MKVAAFGRTQWLYDSIRAAVARGHEVRLIGTCPAAPEYSVTEGDFRRLADELGCAFFCDSAINRPEYVRMAAESGAEAAISVNWLTLVGEEMRAQFAHGVINAHAGDLPRFRGNACPNWAIIAGESRVVLTLHRMAAGLDAGPILLQRSFPLGPETYIADVYNFIGGSVPQMFVEVLDGLEAGTLRARAQPADPALSLRCFPRLPRDGQIDWAMPAEQIARLVRASAEPFAGAYSFLGADKVVVWRARPGRLPYPYLGAPGQVGERRPAAGEVVVLTGDGLLVLEEVETAASGRRPAAEVIRSARARLGLDAGEEIARLRSEIERLKGGPGEHTPR
jgi:methionyl-tRNA formyltransferase